MATENRIRFGIIGCGIIVQDHHLPALQRLTDRYEVTAVCNHTRPKAEKVAGELGLDDDAIWLDWEKLVAEAPVDAVLIALPIELNYPVSEAAAAAGKHVLCEKPMGQSMEEVRRALSIGDRHGVTYMVAEDIQFVPQLARAAEIVAGGGIGELVAISWNRVFFMPLSDKYAQTGWRIRHQYPGGYVLDGGVHYIHALQMMAGPVATVRGHTASVETGLGEVDTAFALLTHRNGVVSSLNMSWHLRDEAPRMKLYGTESTLVVSDSEILRIGPADTPEKIDFEQEDDYYTQLIEFHRAVSTGEPPVVDSAACAHDVEVILAILESAAADSMIRLEAS